MKTNEEDIDQNKKEIQKIPIDKYSEQIDAFKANKDELLMKRLETIENNINKILSKFAKTSWQTLIFNNYN